MKLHEIKRAKNRRSLNHETIFIEPAGGAYGEFDVDVAYELEAGGSTQHVPGDPTTREYHEDEINIESITLTDRIDKLDKDGEPTGKFWKKGSDARELTGWSEKDDELVRDKIAEMESSR